MFLSKLCHAMLFLITVLVSLSLAYGLPCHGSHKYYARGRAYFPSNDPTAMGYVDMHGHPLHTLQDFLEGKSSFVSVAMDSRGSIAYGTTLCIQEMNDKYNRNIIFKVVDTGSDVNLKGYHRIDIFVRTQQLSHDTSLNGALTLYFP